jgi:hypothetical protein
MAARSPAVAISFKRVRKVHKNLGTEETIEIERSR